jgi:hypothetical protein
MRSEKLHAFFKLHRTFLDYNGKCWKHNFYTISLLKYAEKLLAVSLYYARFFGKYFSRYVLTWFRVLSSCFWPSSHHDYPFYHCVFDSQNFSLIWRWPLPNSVKSKLWNCNGMLVVLFNGMLFIKFFKSGCLRLNISLNKFVKS